MSPGPHYVAFDKRITGNDYRPASRLTAPADEEGTASTGWTWVAVLVVAALFIVSGYWDQESGIVESANAAATQDRYAPKNSAPQVAIGNATRADRQSGKGY